MAKRYITCPLCDGEKKIDGDWCTVCDGFGTVEEEFDENKEPLMDFNGQLLDI